MRKSKKLKILSVCLALCGALASSSCEKVLSLLEKNPPESLENSSSGKGQTESGAFINSLDKWNYYAGKKTVSEHYGVSPILARSEKTQKIKPMGDSDNDYGYGYETSDGQVIEGEKPNSGTNLPQGSDTIVYYDLCDWEELVINTTVYFQIELTDENGFLGARLGTGTAEVVVSLGDYLGDLSMITFRNGDRFYSCLYHGYGGVNEETLAEKYYFAAYRYIDGFYYVKNLKWEHYEFCVELGAEGVSFTCDYRHTGEENEQPIVKAGSFYRVDETVRYTIEELEAYFGDSGLGKEENSTKEEEEGTPMDSVANEPSETDIV